MFVAGLILSLPIFSYRPPSWSIPQEWKGQVAHTRPKMAEKVIALTFDDGPVPGTTDVILDALRDANATATFFVCGRNATLYPDLMARMITEGHVVANHTWSHPAKPSLAQAHKQLFDTQTAIYATTLRKPNLFRPPYGIRNAHTTKLAQRSGMAVVLWTLTAADTGTKKWEDVYTNIVIGAKPGDIALLHDVKPHTAKAMPKVLRDLKKNGFRMVAVPEMLTIWSQAQTKAATVPSTAAAPKTATQ